MNTVTVLVILGAIAAVVIFFLVKKSGASTPNASTPTPSPTPTPTPDPTFDGKSIGGVTKYIVYGEAGGDVIYTNASGSLVTTPIVTDSVIIFAKDGFTIDGDFISIQAMTT